MSQFGLRFKLIAVPATVLLLAMALIVTLLFSRIDTALREKQDAQFEFMGGVLRHAYAVQAEQLVADMRLTAAQTALYDGYFAAQQDDRTFLKKFLDQIRDITASDEVLVFGGDGKVLARSGDEHHGDRPYYAELAAPMLGRKTPLANAAALGETIYSRLGRNGDGPVELVVVGPVLDVETVVGAIAFVKRLDQRFLEGLRTTFGSRVQLSVAAGDEVISSTFATPWHLPQKLAPGGGELVSEVAGRPNRHAFFPLDGDGGTHVGASFDLSDDQAAQSGLLTSLGLVFLLGGALVLATIVWNVLRIVRSLELVAGHAAQVADGDLRGDIADLGSDEVGRLARAFAAMSVALARIATAIRQAALETAHDADDLAQTTEHLVRGASAETEQTEQMATALTELAQTAQEVARNAGSASAAAQQAYDLAQTGTSRVRATVEAIRTIADDMDTIGRSIQTLGDRSQEIGQIVTVIDGIAAQTNLLALNAAIEAARAGEQGRGFAVVADEVRTLAGRTAEATKEIGSMITKIQEETRQSVAAVESGHRQVARGVDIAGLTREAMEGIVGAASHSMDMIHQIAAAAEEQSQVAEQVSEAVEHIVGAVRQEEQEAGAIQRSVEHLRGTAASLRGSAEWFRT